MNKQITLEQAVEKVQDGMTIMVGGFLGTGSPEVLMDALVRKGVKHLTVIGNDGNKYKDWCSIVIYEQVYGQTDFFKED